VTRYVYRMLVGICTSWKTSIAPTGVSYVDVVKVGRVERRWLQVSGFGMQPDVHCAQFYKKTKVSGIRDPSFNAGLGGVITAW
jgi:hypothetical protein